MISESVIAYKQKNGTYSTRQDGTTGREGIEINIRAAWEEMNSLLGKKVITTINLGRQDYDYLRKSNQEKYILTPEEVVLYVPSLTNGMDVHNKQRYDNPDPTRKEAIETLLKGPGQADYDINSPLYWLAFPVKSPFSKTDKLQVSIYHAHLQMTYGDIPMHIVGQIDNVPVIYCSYGEHCGISSSASKDDAGLLNRMSEAGLAMPKFE
jgi:hypothetical protein